MADGRLGVYPGCTKHYAIVFNTKFLEVSCYNSHFNGQTEAQRK